MTTALRQPGVRPAEGGRWPLWGIGAVLLLTSRLLYPSPSLSTQDQTAVTGKLVDILAEKTASFYFGTGVSWLGVACLVVFLAGLYRRLKASEPADGLVPTVVLGGGLMTAAGLFVGYGFPALAGGNAYEQRAATTVAALYAIMDSFAYLMWTGLGLVTAGVAVAGIRRGSLPRWLGWMSVIFTLIFVGLAFLPFLSWFPALVWLLAASIGLLVSERHTASREPQSAPADDDRVVAPLPPTRR
jgi:hypothetical protein